jgi:acyl-CoA thioesterase FadM
MDPEIEFPLSLYADVVRPEWLDYNQHMSEGYYGVAFSYVTDALMDLVGLHAEYRARTRCTIYTVETHINFLRELTAGSPLAFTTQLLGFDAKRLHVFYEMYHAGEGYLAATMEAMLLHVNDEPRVVPMPPEILKLVRPIFEVHSTMPRPSQAGRSISMPA